MQNMKEGPVLSVIKIGGNVVDDATCLADVLAVVAACRTPVLLVHGGGKAATRLAERLAVPQNLIDGRRITDAETLDIATMVYAGLVNKQVVAKLQALGCNAVGLTGADANMVRATRRPPISTEKGMLDYGFVGDIAPEGVHVLQLRAWLAAGLVPVFCALTHDGKGALLNTNADTLASTLAVALAPHYGVRLVYVFEKKGVLRNVEDEASLVPAIHLAQVEQLIKDGVIMGGMIPKIHNAAQAVQQGVHQVRIGKAQDLAAMLADEAGGFTKIRV